MMLNSTPVVSVILPAFNAARYIHAAINSILVQTFTDFELIVIDDGSTDDTYRIVLGFTDSRMRVLRNSTNLGLVKSLNRGVDAARSGLLARMDADDCSEPDRLAIQVEWMQRNPRLGVLGSYYETFDERHFVLDTVTLPVTDAEVRYNLYGKTHCFCHPAVLMRRQALKEAGGYRDEWFPAEDLELWLRMLENWHGANVPQVLHRLRRHDSSVTSQNARKQAQLVIAAVTEALSRGICPDDIDLAAQQAGWARGEIFVALGLAANGVDDGFGYHLQRAMQLDERVALSSFHDLLGDRVSTFMHHSDADVTGCRDLLDRVFAELPASFGKLRYSRTYIESQVHAIAAFHYSKSDKKTQSRR
ncbi:MAG: glycosyltransferase family 2 protein, partial [Anaerolineae bacterium]|nr:glycosyltransferase family 2 protein [Anaerolineae bacterium]